MYRWHVPDESVERIADGAVIPVTPENRDWRKIEAWVAAGNAIGPPSAQQQRSIAVLRRHAGQAHKPDKGDKP